MPQADSERELIGRMQAGDVSAVADLSSTYGPRIHQLAFRYLKNWEDAEEVAQDVLMKVVHKIQAFRGDSALSSWIYRITFNTAMSAASAFLTRIGSLDRRMDSSAAMGTSRRRRAAARSSIVAHGCSAYSSPPAAASSVLMATTASSTDQPPLASTRTAPPGPSTPRAGFRPTTPSHIALWIALLLATAMLGAGTLVAAGAVYVAGFTLGDMRCENGGETDNREVVKDTLRLRAEYLAIVTSAAVTDDNIERLVKSGLPLVQCRADWAEAALLVADSRYQDARDRLARADERTQEHGLIALRLELLRERAVAALSASDHLEMRELCDQLLALSLQHQDFYSEQRARDLAATAQCLLGEDVDASLEHLYNSLARAKDRDVPKDVYRAHLNLDRVLSSFGREDEARDHRRHADDIAKLLRYHIAA